ncbi:MAG: folate-binding protein YgfZ [Gammaproteobacteria bacterium]|nr:folate-binding protein YgfZ [Gammaproteobacteria bacterium]
MHSAGSAVTLGSLGVLCARGAEARAFLQGQLSNDLTRLTPALSLLAGYHNPQGRVIAILRLIERSSGELLAVLPRELVPEVVQRLGKFILRAKVKLADESAAWTITGVIAGDAGAPADAWPAARGGAARVAEAIAVRVAEAPGRWLLVTPAGASPEAAVHCAPAAPGSWQRLAIAAGEPQVYRPTSEQFVAQMLNLDALGAIDFGKGCYTGQEVIARAHYRGRVKRRLQRFRTRGPHALAPGASGELGDGRSFQVVDAVELADGRCEFLAVAPIIAALPATAAAAAAPPPGQAPRLDAEELALPYALPA